VNGAAIAAELRRAVSAGLYPQAQAVLSEYRRALDSLPTATPQQEEAFREAAKLIEWARRTALAKRAAAAARLAGLPAEPARYRAQAPARHTWEIVG
jgi:hypothetical protein